MNIVTKIRLPREIAKRYLTGAGRHGLNRLYTKYYRLTTNWPSTTVENALQIDPFMQNKANFQKSQMNANPYNTTDYENKTNWTLGENEPNTNPIKANTKPIKANKMPKQTQYKPNQTQFQTRRPGGVAPEFLLFTLFDIPNMIYAIRKNTLPTGSIARVLPKKRNVFRRILEKKMEV